jgi:hypothetical protein
VYLFLPDISGRRQRGIARDWRRRPIRVTPAGNVLPGQTGDLENEEGPGTPTVPVASRSRAKKRARRKQEIQTP